MNILGLSTTELIITIILMITLFIGLIGLKIRREQLSQVDPRQRQKMIEKNRENQRIEQETAELSALMYESDEIYDD